MEPCQSTVSVESFFKGRKLNCHFFYFRDQIKTYLQTQKLK